MFTNLKTKKRRFRSLVEEQTTRHRRVIKTTLGDLIVAVMDEVTSFVGDPSGRYHMASWVLNDLLTHHQRHPSTSGFWHTESRRQTKS
jgi:hypothetical protein